MSAPSGIRINVWQAFVAVALLTPVAESTPAAGAASTGDTHHPMRFEQISLDEGLSQSNIFSILQDSRGLLWFGTESGLNSYNGYEFEIHKRERGNPYALQNDYIYDITEDGEGNLWIASNGGGFVRMDGVTRQFRTYRHDTASGDGPSSNVIRKLLVDADGSIWLGTIGAGVDRYDPKRRQREPLDRDEQRPDTAGFRQR